jgi:hypothetical protein
MRRPCPPKTTREQGMPGARCTHGLVCKIVRRNAHEHTGSAEALRHSLRNGFTAYAALSPATNSSCHRHRRIEGLVAPGWARKTSADLTPATGARTTRFYRTQPPVFAQRLNRAMAPSSCAKDTAHGMNPPCNSVSRRRCRVHRIPSRVRDDRDPPLFSGETGKVKSLICPTAPAEYFCRQGWTEKFASATLICPSGNQHSVRGWQCP